MSLRFSTRVLAALMLCCGITLATPRASQADMLITVTDNFGHSFSTGDVVATSLSITAADLQAHSFFIAGSSSTTVLTATVNQSSVFTSLFTSGSFTGTASSTLHIISSANGLTLPGGTTRTLNSSDTFNFNGVFPGSGSTTDSADLSNVLGDHGISLATFTYASTSNSPNGSPTSATGTMGFSGVGPYALTTITDISVVQTPGNSQYNATDRVDAQTTPPPPGVPAPPALFLVGAAVPVLAVRRWVAKRKAVTAVA
jgi:hypothetical protein